MVVLPDLTTQTTVGQWVSGSTVRGTWDIVSMCYSTILICVYSAFHDDIPRTRPENRRHLVAFLELIRWTFIFLLLPEILPSAAVEQLRETCIIYWSMKSVQVRIMQWWVRCIITFIYLNRNQGGHSPIHSTQRLGVTPSRTSTVRPPKRTDTISISEGSSS